MQLVIPRMDAPELFQAIDDMVARARGARLKYLATLGLKVEREGFRLEHGDVGGKLEVPSRFAASGTSAMSSMPVSESQPVDESAKKQLSQFALSWLGIGTSDDSLEAPEMVAKPTKKTAA